METNRPDLLYHTILTVIDYHEDKSGSTRTVYVLGTHATLEAAKKFAASALHKLNYEPEDFVVYESHLHLKQWPHGDGVIVFARAPAGQEFLIGIDTKPNDLDLLEGQDGSIALPQGVPHLHYVLQTKIDYHQDRSGASQTTEIEGCYLHREDAVAAAYECLAGEQPEFAEYDRSDSIEMKNEVSLPISLFC
jgi:hypothetical protein